MPSFRLSLLSFVLLFAGICGGALPAFADAKPTLIALKQAHQRVNQALARRKIEAHQLDKVKSARDEKVSQVAELKAKNASEKDLHLLLREALVLDENVAFERAQLVAADGEVARTGASLFQLYDGLLLKKRREIESPTRSRAAKKRSLQAYRMLAKERDALRRLLAPAMGNLQSRRGDLEAAIRIQEDDDAETLLEKADLAHDLEERYFRRAAAVRRRIIELEQERVLARDVLGLARTQGLFDESDRRLQGSALASAASRRTLSGAALGALAFPAETEERSSNDETFDTAPPPQASGEDPTVAGDTDGLDDFSEEESGDSNADSSPPSFALQGIEPPSFRVESAFSNLQSQTANLEQLLSGDLSLQELKTLEKRLKAHARQMKKQSATLEKTARHRE
ncbi:MAG: hypothetical protein GY822_19660 [Deltaproteobacteria bacterium]|nr:hypothetical protein [Deltaproteobacteria bacterium]